MRAILVHIGWVTNPKTAFCEMTEIAAMELQAIDEIIVCGGTFHSYIRPIFQHWKLKKANHNQYTNWWLAPTYTQVMNDFSRWMDGKKTLPWIVWSNKTFSVWQSNSVKHEYQIRFPKMAMYLQKEFQERGVHYSVTLSYLSEKDKEAYTKKVVREFGQLLSSSVPFTKLELMPLHVPVVSLQKKDVQKDRIVNQLLKLVQENKVTLDEISEWSRLTKAHIDRIFKDGKKINKFERERLREAWTMWETVMDFREDWLDS